MVESNRHTKDAGWENGLAFEVRKVDGVVAMMGKELGSRHS